MNLFRFLSEWINDNPGKTVGAFIGFLAGMFILTLGPLKTFIIILFIIIGVLVGKTLDDDIPVFEQIKGIFRRGKKHDDIDFE